MRVIERIASIAGLGRDRRSFHENLVRYFAGDLDAVERRSFEIEIMSSSYRRRVFASAYDRRTRTLGFDALESSDPDISECFSVRTLEAYAGGRLSRADRRVVEAHLACPVCGEQLEGMRRATEPGAEAGWRDRADELLGRLLGLVLRPAPLVAVTAGVLLLAAAGRIALPPERSARAPVVATHRSTGDGLAAVELRAVDGDLREQSLEAGHAAGEVRLAADTRLRIVGVNDDLEFPRYVALLSIGDRGEVRWHIPTWDGALPPTMVELPPGERHFDRIEPVPGLDRGRHQLVLLLSHTPANLARIHAQLSPDLPDDSIEETFVDALGPRSSMTRWEVVVP